MHMGQKIRALRQARGLTLQQVGDHFGINRASVADWESGKTKPEIDKLPTLARILGTDVDTLLEVGTPLYSRSGAKPVVVRDADDVHVIVRRGTLKLSAGITGWAIEFENHDAPPIVFRRDWVEKSGFRPDKLLALKVQGSSMETGLYDGDTVVVNLADTTPIDGEVFAVNFEGECVIKRLKRDGGEWWFTSDNADKRRYPDKRASDGVQLLGRIVFKQSERI